MRLKISSEPPTKPLFGGILKVKIEHFKRDWPFQARLKKRKNLGHSNLEDLERTKVQNWISLLSRENGSNLEKKKERGIYTNLSEPTPRNRCGPDSSLCNQCREKSCFSVDFPCFLVEKVLTNKARKVDQESATSWQELVMLAQRSGMCSLWQLGTYVRGLELI